MKKICQYAFVRHRKTTYLVFAIKYESMAWGRHQNLKWHLLASSKKQNVTALSDFACSTIGPHHFIVNLWFLWNVLDISQLSWHPFSGLLYQSVFYAGPDVLNKMKKKDLSSKILCSPFSGQFLSQKHGALPWSHLAPTYHSDTCFFNKEISFFTWSLSCFFLCSCC